MGIVAETYDLKRKLADLKKLSEELRGYFDLDAKKRRLQELAMAAENPDLWNKPQEMQKLNKEKAFLEKAVSEYEGFSQGVADAEVLTEMSIDAQDEASFAEAVNEASRLEKIGQDLELKRVLNGELDANSTYLTINSGAGGTEACDWAAMLMRMYMRYAEQQGYRVEVLEMSDGEGAGIKSVTLLIEGPYAYGYLKAENGVHRLVRISPFDSNARRHTSFASVFAWAEIDDEIKIDLKMDDVRVETYRASGAGGQHVNRTDSAVRMTHIPSGIVVQCQSERSQIQNREKSIKMLKAALYEKEVEERNKAKQELESTKKANEWGSQIRSYVMHPYQMAKDHRTLFETSQVQDVMNGDLQGFIMAYLKSQLPSSSAEASK
ncbi:MAG: peptide chain release factor 2 [Bdellovibrio sp. CG10_big_fil_rev_8_21_14_0_10_47_8]|nr:MAG: peptide chain release factor 2 [Bdellovibrio sp. CG10_big_fil_rev_8_21_14_0_10_47_8]